MRLIVRYASGFYNNVVDEITRLGGIILHSSRYANYIVVEVDPSIADALRRIEGVIAVYRPRTFTVSSPFFHARRVLDSRFTLAFHNVARVWYEYSILGRHVKVAVLDSGVYPHPALKGKVIAEYNAYGGGDIHGGRVQHGTFIAGLIVAEEVWHGGFMVSGVAPKARIINIKVLNDEGFGSEEHLLMGFEKALELQADIINISLGILSHDYNSPLRELIKAAASQGVIVVASAGNSGPKPRTINYPGCIPECVTVGSVNSRGEPSIFSSRGPVDDIIKPDVTALGGDYDEVLFGLCGPGYATRVGTSFSTAIVSGILALLLEARSVDRWELEDLLRISCNGPMTKSIDVGWGLLDSYALVSGRAGRKMLH